MRFNPQERTALFIDGANLYAATRSLGFDVDYRRLLDYFDVKLNLIRAYYYSALLETEEYSPLKPLTDWLAYNGYSLVTKPAKEFTDPQGRRRI
ncbi:MAG TPA: NYN domain-containing protein, partial [Acidocella sp.]|nr:NYN domain-containing protein [Acidocella sp.]